VAAGLLAAAMVIDAAFGEPDWAWRRVPHPAVLIGRAVGWLEARLNAGAARRARGALAVAALVAGAGAAGAALAALPDAGLIEMLAVAILLAQRSLAEHVQAVAEGLRISLAEGRAMVARIVGRDTDAMDEPAVARAAIESAAENLSDGVVAPAFWYLVAGLPGILIYKAVNTADSMIGHRSPRHAAFGWAAARLDDLLNLIPARLSALLIAAAALRFDRAMLRSVLRDAPLHRSPNAGWPEAAMAAALGVAIAGPRRYHGVVRDDPWVFAEGRRDLGAADIDAAIDLLWRAWGVGLALVLVAAAV
jgi:adenosylcobinamide-phosphate synthase